MLRQCQVRGTGEGCADREVIDASGNHFDWQEILHSASSMSLFAERKLVELRLPSGKPGRTAVKPCANT